MIYLYSIVAVTTKEYNTAFSRWTIARQRYRSSIILHL